jgi:hypothetical protein
LDPVPLSKMETHLLASQGSKGKNRNPLACLRNASFHSAVTYCSAAQSRLCLLQTRCFLQRSQEQGRTHYGEGYGASGQPRPRPFCPLSSVPPARNSNAQLMCALNLSHHASLPPIARTRASRTFLKVVVFASRLGAARSRTCRGGGAGAGGEDRSHVKALLAIEKAFTCDRKRIKSVPRKSGGFSVEDFRVYYPS